ncbi:hypothetical protein SAMN05446037_100323 [Anaerovirgula multivorans]|uniref:Uncharacterized protein n=1 Tax=Anaerovirgula multivorans TaxID=312168 RepID=A0A239B7R6_9FIRM|nr:hypothetical protein [Anaerovirgula multivorans]SNS03193.1 hypothetical protein SAMN05446037_100323 [Anaerovirgula multivorans]
MLTEYNQKLITLDQLKQEKKITINLHKLKEVCLRNVYVKGVDSIEIKHIEIEEEQFMFVRFLKDTQEIAGSPLGLVSQVEVREFEFTVYLEY